MFNTFDEMLTSRRPLAAALGFWSAPDKSAAAAAVIMVFVSWSNKTWTESYPFKALFYLLES